MKTLKTQDAINKSEWENPENWSSIYFSKKDSRTYVHKKIPRHGWTINFGSKSGARWIYYFFAVFSLTGCILGAVFTAILMWLCYN